MHENFERAHSMQASSDRSFGLVFAAFLALAGIWPLLHKRPMRTWAFAVSAAFLLLALAVPALLHPLNRAWTRLGYLISRITNPVVTGLMFYVIFTPAALVLRMLGKDLLRLKFDPGAASYWIIRNPPGPAPRSLRNQF